MNKIEDIIFFPMGSRAVLITWQEEVNPHLLQKLLDVKANIQHEEGNDIWEVITTYNSLLIHYKENIQDFDNEVSQLKATIATTKENKHDQQKIYYLPVCYDKKFGLDLEEITAQKEINISTIIELHTSPTYTVYFTGFLPGFPYLGGLSEKLYFDRKKNPRKRIPKGAVGIGGNQTGIYPSSSPGGWQLIGNCPVNLFNISNQPPCLFKPGDQIKFESISVNEYQNIQSEIKNQTFHLKSEPCQ